MRSTGRFPYTLGLLMNQNTIIGKWRSQRPYPANHDARAGIIRLKFWS